MELDPGHFKAVYNRAFSYDKVSGRPVLARACCQLTRLPPPLQMGRLEHAVTDYTRAIELEPRNANAFHNRGSTSDKVREGGRGAVSSSACDHHCATLPPSPVFPAPGAAAGPPRRRHR